MAREMELKYGCNPNQKPAKISVEQGDLPVNVLNGKPGYINFLDALNGWQLVRELKEAVGLPAATSFKHVSPAGVAVGLPIDGVEAQMYYTQGIELTPLACAYARARGADRMSSFGDWIALSDVCDKATALLIKPEVSDGIIAPGYTPEALEILKSKRKGSYNIVEIDPNYVPKPQEYKEVFGIAFEQGRNEFKVDPSLFGQSVTQNKEIPQEAVRDMTVALITLKYTQSNSVCYVYQGQAIGIGAGQQSRIHCTCLAGSKADLWQLRHHPKVLNLPLRPELGRPERDNTVQAYLDSDYGDVFSDGMWQTVFTEKPEPLTTEERQAWLSKLQGVTMGSDAFFPFGDNIQRAAKSGVTYVVQPGGSIRDDNVIAVCDENHMAMVFTGLRLFHH